MPHVDVPDKHFGVALGEARTLRTATKGHLEHRTERQKLATCEDGIPTRGAGRVRGVCFCARKTWGRRGHVRIAPPPRSKYVSVLSKVAISGWRWGAWWKVSKGTRRPMTKPHLSGRGAGRRRGSTKIAAPSGVGGRRGHGDGRHHHGRSAAFFHQILIDV